MIDYSEDYLISLLFKYRGSVAPRATLFALPTALISLILVCLDDWEPSFRESIGVLDLNKSQLWTATTAILGLLLGFRTNRAMARFWEGTGLLHQMRGEWFDSISCCVTFSVGAVPTKRAEVYRFRHTAVRLMSLCHGSALEEIAGEGGDPVETIDSLGLDNATLAHLKACKEVHHFNRVEVILHLTQSIITKALDDGILKIPPPILSRVYQTLSRGFVNLLNAKKIADTRFPFPYAQLIAILLWMHILMTPLMISCLIPHRVWAPIFTFVPVFATFSVNFIGVELENPFGSDDNDLPLAHFQDEMNKCLMMLLHEGADLIADVSPSRCIMDFSALVASMGDRSHGDLSPYQPPVPRIRKSVSDFASLVDVDADDKLEAELEEEKENQAEAKPPDKAAPPPPVPSPAPKAPSQLQEPKKQAAEPKSLQPEMLTDYDSSLPGLKLLVETQVHELSRSIGALTQFSEALPAVIDSMLTGRNQSHWRRALLHTRSLYTSSEQAASRSSSRGSCSEVPAPEASILDVLKAPASQPGAMKEERRGSNAEAQSPSTPRALGAQNRGSPSREEHQSDALPP